MQSPMQGQEIAEEMVLMVVVVMMEVVMMMRSRVERRRMCKKSWVQCNLQRRKRKRGKRERDS